MNNDLIARRVRPASPAAPPSQPAPAADPASDRPLYRPELEPDDQFVSYSPPWLTAPEDDLWAASGLAEATGREPAGAEAAGADAFIDASKADPTDALAPIAEDLLVSAPARLPSEPGPELDLAAILQSEPAGPPQAVATAQTTGFGWSPAVRYSSVFGDLFRQPAQALTATGVRPDTAPSPDVDVSAHAATATSPAADPFDWPPVPVDLFPPLATPRPELNLEPEGAPEVEIRWPEDPRAQIFWPGEQEATSETPAPVGYEVAPSAAEQLSQPPLGREIKLQHDPIYTPRDPRFEPRFLLEDVPADRPLLIFSDPPSSPPPGRESAPGSEPRVFEGPFSRLGNHASGFAERMPDHWALSAAPSLAVATEEAVARELAEIQSPALTVLFAVVVIAAVLLFVFLVTPLLR